MPVLEQLVKHGRVMRGSTGAKVADVTPAKSAELKLGILKGAIITEVKPGSPADKSGAMVDDVITGVMLPDGRMFKITSAAELRAGEGISEVGRKVDVEVNRGGQTIIKTITMGEQQIDHVRVEVPASIVRLAGLVLTSLEADSPLFGEVRGAVVTEVKPQTFAQLVGLLPGDIITAIDQDKVRQPDDVVRLAKERDGKFDIHLIRNRVPVLVKFPL